LCDRPGDGSSEKKLMLVIEKGQQHCSTTSMTKEVLLLLWTRLTTLTKWTHLLTTNKLRKNLNPTPALQRKFNSKIFTLKKTDAIDTQRYY